MTVTSRKAINLIVAAVAMLSDRSHASRARSEA